jgi:site-specific DNA recombinase
MNDTQTVTVSVALYARVSTQRQEKEATIESQIAELRKRAADERWHVVDLYADNGYSGTTLERPALDRLRSDAHAGRFTHVLILDPSRLARRYVLAEIVTEELRSLGIALVYCNHVTDDSPEGRLLDGMQGLLAEYERAKILDRTRRGIRHKVASGQIWRGREIMGYRYIEPVRPGEKHGHFEIDEAEAAIVRWIFEQVAAGKSTIWVAAQLDARAVPTMQGGKWRDSHVARMIHNTFYSGEAVYGRQESCEPQKSRLESRKRRKSSVRDRSPEHWHTVPVPAIVSTELQQAALAALARNRKFARRNAKQDYLLSGLLVCGRPDPRTGQPCGHRLTGTLKTGRSAETGRVYRCNGHHFADGQHFRCKGHVPAHHIEAHLWDLVKRVVRQPAIVRKQFAALDAAADLQARRLGLQAEAAAGAVEAAQNKLDRLLTRNLEGKVDDATFDRMQPTLVAERDAARQRLEELTRWLAQSELEHSQWATVEAYCADVNASLAWLEQPEQFAARQALVRTLVHQVTLRHGEMDVLGRLPCLTTTMESAITQHTPRCTGGRRAAAMATASGAGVGGKGRSTCRPPAPP